MIGHHRHMFINYKYTHRSQGRRLMAPKLDAKHWANPTSGSRVCIPIPEKLDICNNPSMMALLTVIFTE